MDRPHMQVDGLQAAESPLHLGQALVGADCRGIIEVGGRHVGAHDVDAVESGFHCDGVMLAAKRKARLADRQIEVLGHLVAVDDLADSQADFRLAAQRSALSSDRRRDFS